MNVNELLTFCIFDFIFYIYFFIKIFMGGAAEGLGRVQEDLSSLSLTDLAARVTEGLRAKAVLVPKLIEAITAQLAQAFYSGCCSNIRLTEDYGSELRFQALICPNTGGHDPVADMLTAQGWEGEAYTRGAVALRGSRFLENKS